MTFSNQQVQIYVNGKLEKVYSCTRRRRAVATDSDDILIFGEFSGTIEDIAIYNRALSREEIIKMMNFGTPSVPDVIENGARFDEIARSIKLNFDIETDLGSLNNFGSLFDCNLLLQFQTMSKMETLFKIFTNCVVYVQHSPHQV